MKQLETFLPPPLSHTLLHWFKRSSQMKITMRHCVQTTSLARSRRLIKCVRKVLRKQTLQVEYKLIWSFRRIIWSYQSQFTMPMPFDCTHLSLVFSLTLEKWHVCKDSQCSSVSKSKIGNNGIADTVWPFHIPLANLSSLAARMESSVYSNKTSHLKPPSMPSRATLNHWEWKIVHVSVCTGLSWQNTTEYVA